MKIEDASQFLQVNAVAKRVRQLIATPAQPRIRTDARRPTAIALAELRAGRLEVYGPEEAAGLRAAAEEEPSEEDRAAGEVARASFEGMFADPDGDATETGEQVTAEGQAAIDSGAAARQGFTADA